ncbi:MAG: cyclase family protein [Pseudomonadota bacterium]
MPEASNAGPAVNFSAATSLAMELNFNGAQPQHFGAPAASATAFCSGDFEGDVRRGASCNCSSITLIPHCNGTHTESVGHLTAGFRPLHEFVPLAPIPALLLSVDVVSAAATAEDSVPAPHQGDSLITREGLLKHWPAGMPITPRALLLRTRSNGEHATQSANPPYLTRQAASEMVERGIEHLVVDLPSVDRTSDTGKLTAHRVFFGLPPGSTDARVATRAHCTITELAQFPTTLKDGPCALQLQFPAFTGDAVPSRPVHLPLATT